MHHPSRSVFDATGAFYREGRWHSIGTRVLYTAEHISLAALEILIHAGGRKIPHRVVTEILIPDSLVAQTTPWIDLPESRTFGDEWAAGRRSPLLRVPSIAADKLEFNVVINPEHPEFRLLAAGQSHPFHFDERFIHLE